ncbi:MAG: glycosyltransferase [Ramlibacter sp.]|nr:glycosyltransferase [Ramlibacter sp.]
MRLVLPHLIALGCDVEVLTVHPDDVAGPQDPALAAQLPSTLRLHRVRAPSFALWGLQGLAQRSFLPLYRKGNELLANGNYDLVFFSTTEFLLHALGPMWRRKFGIPFCMDLQDPWVNDYYRDNPHIRPPGGRLKHAVASRLHRMVEKAVVPRASGFLSVSPAYLPMMEQRHGALVAMQPRLVATFPAEPGEFAGIASTEVSDAASTTKVWRYVGRGGADMARAASAFFLAWREAIGAGLLTENQVRFEALGTSYASEAAAMKTLEPLALPAGLASRVSEVPARLGYMEMLRTLNQSDALIVFGSDDPAYTASKIYPYLLARKPLLCIFHEKSSVVGLIRSVGGAACVSFNERTSELELVTAIRHGWFDQRNYQRCIPLDAVAFEPHTARSQAAQLVPWFEQVVAYRG